MPKKYEEKDSLPVEIDTTEIKKLGLEIVTSKLIQDNKEGLVRHSPARLARSIYYWYRKTSKKGSSKEACECKEISNKSETQEFSEEYEKNRKENSKV